MDLLGRKRFLFGAWNAPANDEKFYRWLRGSGIDLLMLMGNYVGVPNTPVYDRAIELCEAFGVHTLVDVSHTYPIDFPAGYPEKDCFLGFLVKDEPVGADFAMLREQIARYQEAYPDALLFINLFPSYVDPATLGMSYDDYVERYAAEVLTDIGGKRVLSFDYYPLVNLDGRLYLNETWLRDTERIAVCAERYGAQRHAFIQAMPIIGSRDRIPSTAEIRLQAYVYLAYGYSMMSYFCYATPQVNFEFAEDAYAMIDRAGCRTHIYDSVKKVNRELQDFAPAYLSMSWKGVLPVPGEGRPDCEGFSLLRCAKGPGDFPRIRGVRTTDDLLIGGFEDEGGREGFILVHYGDVSEKRTASVQIAFRNAAKVTVCRGGRKKVLPLEDGRCSLRLGPGGGCFLLPE